MNRIQRRHQRPALILTVAMLAFGCGSPEPEAEPRPVSVSRATPAAAPAPEVVCSSPVRPNVMSAVERFGKWVGGKESVPQGENPEAKFEPVTASPPMSLRNTTVYVLTHGWAPGWNDAVLAADTRIHWWSKAAGIGCDASTGLCEWPSDFAWTASSAKAGGKEIVVSQEGLLPAIVVQDPQAVVFAYSWLDDSATVSGLEGQLSCAYHSEGYTNLNGLRLAYGLEQILGPHFWDKEWNNRLHLIGHSHGTKVVTTATRTLQRGGRKVDHLTILDSPETYGSREVGAANFNWLYLSEMKIGTGPRTPVADALFVDNYVSEFGMPYTDFEALAGVVDVHLDPRKIYGSEPEDWADDHTYAATWYAGAAPGGAALETSLGLAWKPGADLEHGYKQTWPKLDTKEQFVLEPTAPTPGDGFQLASITFSDPQPPDSEHWDAGSQTLTFGNGASGKESFGISFGCDWDPPFHDPKDYEGLAFDVRFSDTTADDRLIVTLGGSRYMVLDGGALPSCSTPPCAHTVSFDAGNEDSSLGFEVELANESGSAEIVLDRFRCIELWE